jgi:hypothetical protein
MQGMALRRFLVGGGVAKLPCWGVTVEAQLSHLDSHGAIL